MTTVFLSLGSNLNDREKNIRAAIAALMNSGTLSDTKSSSLYESEPWGNRDQPWFVNCVIKGTTALGPYALLMKLLAIETQFGRVRAPETKWQPRTLDIDILLYGRLALQMPTTRPKAKQLMPPIAGATFPSFLRTDDENALLKAALEGYTLSVTHLNNFLDVTNGGPQKFIETNLLQFPQRPTTANVSWKLVWNSSAAPSPFSPSCLRTSSVCLP